MLLIGWIANAIALIGFFTEWWKIRKARRANDEPHSV
jgi:hypothetical protein